MCEVNNRESKIPVMAHDRYSPHDSFSVTIHFRQQIVSIEITDAAFTQTAQGLSQITKHVKTTSRRQA